MQHWPGVRHNGRMKIPRLLALIGLSLLAAGPASQELVPPDARYLTPEGKVRVVGYNDMDEMLVPLARMFEARHPGIRFELILKGTRTAPAPLMDGTSAFAPMGAEFEPGDLANWRRVHRFDPVPVPIAHDSLTSGALSSPTGIFVHESKAVHGLSVAALRRIMAPRPDERRIRFWRALGVAGPEGDRPIRVIGLAPDTAIGALMLRRMEALRYVPGFDGRPQSREVAAAVAHDRDAISPMNEQVNPVKHLIVAERLSDTRYLEDIAPARTTRHEPKCRVPARTAGKLLKFARFFLD